MDGITLTARQRRALERQLSETTDARLFRTAAIRRWSFYGNCRL